MDITNIICTSISTIIGGVTILVLGQIITRLFIDPLIELRKIIGEVAETMIYHANIYSNPGAGRKERREETQQILRQKASLLSVRADALLCYNYFSCIKIIPTRKQVKEAYKNLIGISNSVDNGNPEEILIMKKSIQKALNLSEF